MKRDIPLRRHLLGSYIAELASKLQHRNLWIPLGYMLPLNRRGVHPPLFLYFIQ